MKKAPDNWDYFHGAELQNLLKLFEAIINGTLTTPKLSLQSANQTHLIIY
ncbi:MAG: hypothetical protein WAW80_00610 [Candidatus Saccharimonadales bacterium]